MTEILLVNSPIKDPYTLYRRHRSGPPLGLAYIAAVLLENGFSVSAVDMNVPFIDFEYVRKKIEREEPIIVGISACTEAYSNALRIAKIAKEVNSEIVTVVGGPHVTFTPIDTLRNKEIDIVVRGEGEITMLELANHFIKGTPPIEKIRGISYKAEGDIIYTNPDRPFIHDLDRLPFPARHLFPLRFYQFPGNISTSRGCPYNCIFCSASAMWGRKYRTRTPKNVIKEIIYLVEKYGIRSFTFVDDTFTVSRRRTYEICELIKALTPDIKWQCSTRVDTVTEGTLSEMKNAGCYAITLGVESGSLRILNEIRKGITLDQVRRDVRYAVKLALEVYCSFMLPHPGDTIETVKETKDFMKELVQLGAMVTLAFTVPYPGTYLYNNAEALGIRILSKNWDDFTATKPIISTKHLSVTQIKNLYKEIVSDMYDFMPRNLKP